MAAGTGASASGQASQALRIPPKAAARALAGPGAQLWAKRYGKSDTAYSVAVSPNGKTVFVTGVGGKGYATVAYNAVTGARRWVKNYGNNVATSVAVSPTGTAVYVTGDIVIAGTKPGVDYATVAYNAATGAQLWAKRYRGPGNSSTASSVAVSPSGGTVFVTGKSANATGSRNDYATVAYNAATGAQLWAKRYIGGTAGINAAPDVGATSLAVSPSGATVFVTGDSKGNYGTVAYNAATGAQQWAKRYSGPVTGVDIANAVAVSPSGATVFVTGESQGHSADYATVAYSATNGARLWVKRYNGPHNGQDAATSLAVSPDGGTVFVTGWSDGASGYQNYLTFAYNATTGARQWSRRYGPTAYESLAYAVAVSPTGSTVYVTGDSLNSTEYATVAYNATTGAQQWAQHYKGVGLPDNVATSIAVSPTSGTVFVTGYSYNSYATIAYRG